MSKLKLATVWLDGCSGCHMSFLDMDERILPLLTKVTIHRSSLTDIKRITQRCAIAFIEGGVNAPKNSIDLGYGILYAPPGAIYAKVGGLCMHHLWGPWSEYAPADGSGRGCPLWADLVQRG